MTILGNFQRRKDLERAMMKVRSPTPHQWKRKHFKPNQRPLNASQSPIQRHLIQIEGPIVPIPITVETMRVIEVEVMDLGVSDKPVSVSAMANALAGSRRVVSQHGIVKANSTTLAGRIAKRLRNFDFRRTSYQDESLSRRYSIINAFNRLEKVPTSCIKLVASWKEAKKELSTILTFPDDSQKEKEGDDNDTDASTSVQHDDTQLFFARKLDECFRIQDQSSLVPLTDKWKQVASYPIPSKLGAKDDDKNQQHNDALEIADQMFTLRLESAIEAAEQARASKAAKELEERQLAEEKKAEAEKRASSLMRPLSKEERERVKAAMFGIGPDSEQLARSGTDYVQRASLRTLRPGSWLNDEVIHYFLLMLAKRDEELCQKDPSRKRCHFFKSFFITKLLNEGHATKHGEYEYKNVKRWSKNVPGKDLFNLDKVFFPINVGQSHWLCACAFMLEKRIEVFDSMGGTDTTHLEAIFQYLKDDHLDKKKEPLPNMDEWKLIPCREDTPYQRNGFDCGVFTCMFIDFLSKNCPLVFNQEHITQCRERIALSILNGKAIL